MLVLKMGKTVVRDVRILVLKQLMYMPKGLPRSAKEWMNHVRSQYGRRMLVSLR
jgi:hypothetical protein